MTLFVTLWVFLVLYTLQPFGLNFAIHRLPITYACTSAVFIICLFFLQIQPLLLYKYYSPDNWTSGKFFFLCIQIVTTYAIVATIVLSAYIDKLEGFVYYTYFPPLERFLLFYKICLSVSAFPILIIYYILMKRGKPKLVPQTIPANTEELDKKNPHLIEISGKTKDHVRLLPTDILYAEASGNYVAIHYLKNDNVESKLLRVSLNEVGDLLHDYPYLIRCHRAFIVNTQKLVKIEGNLKRYNLELENTKIKIPVSKSYTRIVKEKITHMDFD